MEDRKKSATYHYAPHQYYRRARLAEGSLMGVVSWPEDMPAEYDTFMCCLCGRETYWITGSVGPRDLNGAQQFTCTRHFRESTRIIVARLTDYLLDMRYEAVKQAFMDEFGESW